jgi:hypothetical protein
MRLEISPVKLRLVLVLILCLLVAIGITAFSFGRSIVEAHARSSQKTAAEARASSSDLDYLKGMKQLLVEKSATVQKTDRLVSESKQYVYQDKIIDDITQYANDAGLQVTNIGFSDIKAASTASASPANSNAQSQGPVPANVKSRTATVTLANPVDYYKMLNFIHSIEQGLFRMRISTIGLSHTVDGSGVASDVLTIEVFVK